MKSRFQQKLPEEIELEQKRAELAVLCARHEDARAVLQQLRDEIARFERVYHQTLGRRIAELERIEAEISRFTGYSNRKGKWEESAPSDGERDTSWESSATASQERSQTSAVKEIKALYREVAKAIHPDLAGAGPAKRYRHELMAKANRAYADDDRLTLQEILRNWRRSPDQAQGDDAGAELVRVIRQIARERQDILVVNETMEELKESYVCRLKLRVDAKLAAGGDLFAELVAAADLNIAKALQRLAALKGERPQEPLQQRQKQKRTLCFPAGFSCGTLYLRDRTSLNYSKWKKLGPAMGCMEIDIDKAVRLDVNGQTGIYLSHVQKLKPDDLQSLFLSEVGDTDLDCIVHLTGLEELYLSGLRLTDAALCGISPLINLKRIYLYHTDISDKGLIHLQRIPGLRGLTSSGNSITDEGLALFQQTIPGVKTVSFQWKR